MLAGIVGVPISAIAFFFLKLVTWLQGVVFTDVPKDVLGFDSTPAWWPLPVLALGGLLVGLAISRLPGTGGHSPADGFKAGGVTMPIELPGVAGVARDARFGAVLGPEAPLIADRQRPRRAGREAAPRRTRPTERRRVIAAAGSFAAISTLLGSPLARRVPADGGVGARRADGRPRAAAGPARRGPRHPDLRRARLPHRLRHVLAGDPEPPAFRQPDRSRSSATRSRSGWLAPSWAARSGGSRWRAAARRAADGAAHARARPADRGPRGRVRPGDRQAASRKCCSPGRTSSGAGRPGGRVSVGRCSC